MSDHILNDRNELVLAVGAPGSIERAKCEHPALIERLRRSFESGTMSRLTASQMFGRAKVPLIRDRVSILLAMGMSQNEADVLGGVKQA